MSRSADAVVVGGGLVGLLCARALAGEGMAVVVVERGERVGAEASAAAAGMLSPQMEAAEGLLVEGAADAARRQSELLDLCLAARDRYPAFVLALEEETGRDVHHRTDGTLVVALDEDEAALLAERAAAQRARGLRAAWLDGDAARTLEPAVAPAAPGALHLPDDHQVDNVALVAAAADAVGQAAGIEVRTGTEALAVRRSGARVDGIETEGGSLAAPFVVVAGGAWSAGLGGLPRRIPVRPVKGQIIALRPEPVPIRATVGGRGVYCVPRDDARVLVGATVEDAGFDRGVDVAATDALRDAAAAVVPALRAAAVQARWAGLRPGTSDDLPVLGPDPGLAGLVYATGHYRNGILLAPLTAECVVAWTTGRPPPVETAPFRPDRFEAG